MGYLDAVRALPEPIFLVDSGAILVDANPAGLRLVGLTTVAGVPLSSVVENPDTELESLFHIWNESSVPLPGRLAWKTGAAATPLELDAWCASPKADGEAGVVIIRCKSPGESNRLELLRREVQARKQGEAELADAVKARDEFIAIAAHELRNPLNVFHLSMQLLYRRFGQIEGIRDILNRSQFQLNRLNMLVERLLDVSRIRSGRYELHRETFDLNDLVQEVFYRFLEQYPNLKMTLLMSGAVAGSWDRGRIDQAITNLLSNAIKYGENNPIDVVVATLRDEAVVSVADQGIGLAPNDITRIFEQFERAAPNAISEGFGLGLWITRQIAQAHGGSVSAEGELGRGSTFTLRLPMDRQLSFEKR